METKVNYALVGAFVVVLSLAIIAAVLWISSGRTAGKEYDSYLAYFTESVSGLNRQAPVKYRGVEVGFVREIALDTEDPQRVRVVLSIERGIPIKQDTVATLSTQGLTGIAFLDLEGGSRDSPLLERGPEGNPVIATHPSLFRRLDTQVTALVSNLSETARNINALIDEPTRATFQRTMRDLDTVVRTLATEGSRTLENSAKASDEMPALVRELARSAAAVERAAEQTNRASAAVYAAAAGATSGVQELRADTLPELQHLVAEARAAAASIARLAQELQRNPDALVVGREPTPPGPGE
ncbi:MAG TPA: MlaD family protein [Myxococcota bacterium]|nr:MlaD family protein [Myxococcota bacterium]